MYLIGTVGSNGEACIVYEDLDQRQKSTETESIPSIDVNFSLAGIELVQFRPPILGPRANDGEDEPEYNEEYLRDLVSPQAMLLALAWLLQNAIEAEVEAQVSCTGPDDYVWTSNRG